MDFQRDLAARVAEREDAHLAGFDQVEALGEATLLVQHHASGEGPLAQARRKRVQLLGAQISENGHLAQQVNDGHLTLRSATQHG